MHCLLCFYRNWLSVHVDTYFFAPQPLKEGELKNLVFYCGFTEYLPPLLPCMGSIIWPLFRWSVEPGNLCKSSLTAVFSLWLLDKIYLITVSLLDEMLNFVSFSCSSIFFFFNITYLFAPWCHLLIMLHMSELEN